MTQPRPAFVGSETWITLFADASFCPMTGAYGWCFWIKHGAPAQTVLHSGGGVGLSGSQQAEVEALRQGLAKVHEIGVKGKRIVVQSDCVGALATIESDLRQLRQMGARLAYTKHVKGHQGNKDKRSSVNTTCDRKAGEHMEQFREVARKQGVARAPRMR